MAKKMTLMDAFPIYGYEYPILVSKECGCMGIPLQLKLPEVYTLDEGDYLALNRLVSGIIEIMGENCLIHKQDLFFGEYYTMDRERLGRDFFEAEDEWYFRDRPYLEHRCFLTIHKVPKNYINRTPQGANQYLRKDRKYFFNNHVPQEYLDTEIASDFESKVRAVNDLINESELMQSRILDFESLFGEGGYYDAYLEASFSQGMGRDLDFSDQKLYIGDKRAQFFTLENLDQFFKEDMAQHEYFGKYCVGENLFPVGNLFSLGFKIPQEHIINQYIYIPEKEKAMSRLRAKARRLDKYARNTKGDKNSTYRDQIYEFQHQILNDHKELVYYHLNVMGMTTSDKGFGAMCNRIRSSFKKLGINVKENTVDRKNLFLGGLMGNGIGTSMEMYSPLSSEMAASLWYFEGGYKNPLHGAHGLRMVDRTSGKPLLVSIYKEPERMDWIFNRGMLVASGSGGGKTFFANSYLFSEYRGGADIVILENGNSYDKLLAVLDGVVVENDDERPFTFNPFALDSYDTVVKNGKRALSEHKLTQLIALVHLLTTHHGEAAESKVSDGVSQTLIELMVQGYYDENLGQEAPDFSFNGFYDHVRERLPKVIKEKGIRRTVFDLNVFLLLLGKYAHGGARAYLLNSDDNRISRLSQERLIYLKLGNLIDNEQLFPIIAFLMIDVFNKKLKDPQKLAVNKILNVDEAWNLFDNPIMANYLNAQSRMARKFGGQPIFISQKVDDFVKSKYIGNTIVVNSHIKVLLDLSEFSNSFDGIRSMLGLNKKQQQAILSLNRDLPKGRKLREMAICWKDRVKVFGLETSLPTKCIFETNPYEKAKIAELHEQHGKDWQHTAKAYERINNHNHEKL
ncbi:TraG family conjugative transposon ATPase [Croceitalea marina]|uniref:TraG family conjugative transposon ATPase n=1 Tax=Croceitalea marina TaxID=1775166 RepID=A0ABW5MTK3_9FLAO